MKKNFIKFKFAFFLAISFTDPPQKSELELQKFFFSISFHRLFSSFFISLNLVRVAKKRATSDDELIVGKKRDKRAERKENFHNFLYQKLSKVLFVLNSKEIFWKSLKIKERKINKKFPARFVSASFPFFSLLTAIQILNRILH